MRQCFNQAIRYWSRGLIGRLFTYFCLFIVNVSFAGTLLPFADAPLPGEHEFWVADPLNPFSEGTATGSTPFTLSDGDFGLSGPLSVGGGYSSLNGQYNINAQYTQKITETFALSGLVEYGPDMYRVGGTVGFEVLARGLAKLSAERFSQQLPFNFESGDIEEDVAQNAYGARYQHFFENNIFTNLNGGIYYADAPNISLDPVEFIYQGVDAINYRNIAGGTSQGFDIGSDLQLTEVTTLSAQLYYDHLRYKTEYTENSEDDAQGFGGGLGVKQLLTDRVSVSALGSMREIYDTYTLGVSWLPSFAEGVEIALLGQRIESHNDTPDSNSVGIQFGFDFGIGGGSARYALAPLNTSQDLETWTQTPAVYMDQVLAVSDEKIELLTENAQQGVMLAMAVPTITSLTPISGPINASSDVTVVIHGSHLTGATAVQFGTYAATQFHVDSDTQITAIAPVVATAGAVNVVVTTPGGTSAAKPYTYQDVPTITTMSPVVGATAGNTVVTITGNNFIGASAVNFGGKPGTSLIIKDAHTITVHTPAGTAGTTVDVAVITPSGTSPATPIARFTYEDKPTVTTVSPNIGPTSGGTQVTITGTGFIGASAVTFGGVSVGSGNFSIISGTQIIATAPVHNAGTAHVTVTTPLGTSAATTADIFTYQAAPTVTSLTPYGGSYAGGTAVTIKGTGFTHVNSVQFGTQQVAYTVNSATSISVISPPGTDPVYVTVTTAGGTSPANSASQFTYGDLPTITNLTPNVGSTLGGTLVTMTGTHFTANTTVHFDKALVANVTVVSDTQITLVAPAHSKWAAQVTVTTEFGTSNAVQFIYQQPPNVSSVTPNSGPAVGDTSVTIRGALFTNVVQVYFGDQPAKSFVVRAANNITAVAPAGSGIVNVKVQTVGGTSAASAANQFTYINQPTVTGVTPNVGLPSGGTAVTITGTDFSTATAVHFGNALATNLHIVDNSTLTVTSPAGAGTVHVTVTTKGGTSITSAADQFTYEGLPALTSIAPQVGLPDQNTTVTLYGNNFTGATAVTFGTVPGIINSVTATTIVAQSPTQADGTIANVTVTTPIGVSTQLVPFTYASIPTMTNVSPDIGLPTGGTEVLITGTGFYNISDVTFGGQQVDFTVINPGTQIKVIAPGGTGTVDINVTTPGGNAIATQAFTYQGPPSISHLSAYVGLPEGNTQITITGENFHEASKVSFGNLDAVIDSVTDTEIIIQTPANNDGTIVNVTVTTPIDTSSELVSFTYASVPTIANTSPDIGPLNGGTDVTINGTGFYNIAGVTFGGVAATYTVNNDTQMIATSPAGNAGTVDISVTTPGGEAIATQSFTYQGPPSISNVSPNAGVPEGGLVDVVIAGTNFNEASAVNFGTVAATQFTVNSNEQITVTPPPGVENTTVNITITTPIDTSSISDNNLYTYEHLPAVTSVSPDEGLPTGGTPVTLNGSNFTTTSSVKFGNNEATFKVNSPTQIIAISPPGIENNTVNIIVTTSVGSSLASSANEFTYKQVPFITGLSPNKSDVEGGIPVVISGGNFDEATQVSFGDNNALDFTVDSPTQITAIAPPGEVGMVSIIVTTPVGTSPKQAAQEFLYVALADIIITPSDITITKNVKQKFTATGIYTDGTTEDLSDAVTWTADNTAVAIIEPNGMATAIGVGVSTISAAFTAESNMQSTATLRVIAIESTYSGGSLDTNSSLNSLAGVMKKILTPKVYLSELEPPEELLLPVRDAQLSVDEILAANAIGVYPRGTEDLTTVATWVSSNPEIATVDQDGIVTAIAPGVATIHVAFKGTTQEMEIEVYPGLQLN